MRPRLQRQQPRWSLSMSWVSFLEICPICILTGAILIPPLFFTDVKEQLAAAQAEMAGQRRANED